MAKKVETVSLIDTFSEFKELKNIDRTTMVSVLEESFRSVIAKMFGTDENYDVIVNPDKGDFEIWRNREVVATRIWKTRTCRLHCPKHKRLMLLMKWARK